MTTIAFSLPKATKAELKVYNVSGRLVKTLENKELIKGEHKYTWRGLNNQGSKVASGVYFYKLKTSDYTKTKKMLLIK